MIKTLSPQIRGLILDMDGVLWRGKVPLVDMPLLFDTLQSRGYAVSLATNNATRSARQVLETLKGFGASLLPAQIVTSSMAVTFLLKNRFPAGGPVFIVGEVGLVEALAEGGFYPARENVVAVVAGLDRDLTYDKIRTAASLIRAGAPFYGSNPDATFPAAEGLWPGAGTVLAAIETASGVKPIVAGKPQPAMFQLALQRMDLAAGEVLVVGDRLDTDILGGQRAGCRTALVLSGVSTREEIAESGIQPDLITSDIGTLVFE